jgi:hypothetical protein
MCFLAIIPLVSQGPFFSLFVSSLLALCRTFEWTRRSGTVLTSLGCRPVEAHCINIWLIRLNLLAFILPFMDFLVTPIRLSSSFLSGGSPRNSRNYRHDRLARLLGYRTIELIYRIVVLSPCQPGNLGECDGNRYVTSLSTRFEIIGYNTLRYDSARTRHVVFTGNRLAWDVNHLDTLFHHTNHLRYSMIYQPTIYQPRPHNATIHRTDARLRWTHTQAGLLGYTTENVTMWTSQTIGGLLNATLGNMVEVGLSRPFLLAQALMQVALM